MWRKGDPHALFVRLQINAVTVEKCGVSSKTKTTYDSATPPLEIHLKEFKTLI